VGARCACPNPAMRPSSCFPHRQLSWPMNAAVAAGCDLSCASKWSTGAPEGRSSVWRSPAATSSCKMHACAAVTWWGMTALRRRPATATSTWLQQLHSGYAPFAKRVRTADTSCAAHAIRSGSVAHGHILVSVYLHFKKSSHIQHPLE
jgi:hypothetical protein